MGKGIPCRCAGDCGRGRCADQRIARRRRVNLTAGHELSAVICALRGWLLDWARGVRRCLAGERAARGSCWAAEWGRGEEWTAPV